MTPSEGVPRLKFTSYFVGFDPKEKHFSWYIVLFGIEREKERSVTFDKPSNFAWI